MKTIPIEKLIPHPLNRHFDRAGEKWNAMVESVREHGVIQMPIARLLDGTYQIVCGHRRVAAAAEAGLTSIACDVREMDDRTVLEILVIENLERENPDPVEEGKLLRAAMAEGLDVNILAHRLKRSVAWITTRQGLLDLGDEVIEAVRKPKDASGHLPMGTVEVILSVPVAEREKAIQLVLHAEWSTEVLGPREAESVIKSVILEPARKKAAWEKESPGLVKAWKKALGTYLTKEQKKELVVQAVRYQDVDGCKAKTSAEDIIPKERRASTADPEAVLRWVHLAILHGVPVWVIPGDGSSEADLSRAVVDERLLMMAEEAAAEPLYEVRGGEKVLVREHAGTPVLKTDKHAGTKPVKDKKTDEKREERIENAVGEIEGTGDPNFNTEDPPEKVITQRMESSAWVDLGPVRELREQFAPLQWPGDAAPTDAPEWLKKIWNGEHSTPEIIEMFDWILALKR